MSERTYRRYRSGDLPEQWAPLFEHPELALAVLRVALRLDAKPPEETTEP
jgi:hypothetical protein